MNGLSLGGSKGLFTHPSKSLGNMFSLKQVVPDVTAVVGGVGGFLVGGPAGAAVGAGLGEAAGQKIEGKSWEKSALSGVEAASIAYGGAELYGAAAAGAAGAAATEAAGGSLAGTGTALGNYIGADTLVGAGINALGADVGIGAATSGLGTAGTGTLLGNAIGSNTLIGGGINALGADVGIGTTESLAGGVVSNPALATALEGSGAVAAPAGYATGAGAAAAGGGGWLADIGGPRTLLSGAGLLMDALKGNQPVKGENQLNTAAAQDTQQGQILQNYLSSGTLPPGAQAAINQATAAAQASIRSQYASMGMSGSSAEAQDIAAAQMAGVTQATNLATQLLQTGISENEFGTQLYADIMNENLQKDNNLGTAIGNFATAMIPGNASAPAATPTAGAASDLASANA
jgi:hypothetical protein